MPDTTASGRAVRGRTRKRARESATARHRRAQRPRSVSRWRAGVRSGGIYEVGALLALADSLDGLDFNELDVYVGVSSGGFVAAALANGISPAQMYRLFIDDGADAALKPEIFLKPAFAEFGRCLAALPALAARATLQYLRDPFHRGVMESFATLAQAIPTGVFDNRAIDAFLAPALRGARPQQRLSQACSASCSWSRPTSTPALRSPSGRTSTRTCPFRARSRRRAHCPGCSRRCVIDGEHYVDGALNKTLHASVALDEGVDAAAVRQSAGAVRRERGGATAGGSPSTS